MAESQAMTALVGTDHCGCLLPDYARYFNRDMPPTMSRQVKALNCSLGESQEKMNMLRGIRLRFLYMKDTENGTS